MICKYCGKECKNLNSLRQHEIRCKLNPNKIHIKSNFIEYNKNVKNGIVKKDFSNQFIKAKLLGIDKPSVSLETKKKLSIASKKQIWDNERRIKHSKIMINAVQNHPESYSSNNVSGRTKTFIYKNKDGNNFNVKGKWELLVAEYLDENNIKWTNIINEEIYYIWEDKKRRYFPDFYLIKYDKYIEVKGYVRERDLKKWEVVSNKLIIIKKDLIKKIKNKTFNIFELL